MGIKERKERERKRRKDQILTAAIDLIEEHGFEKTTMDEIADRAELSKGTLYLYYSDKATLYLAIKKRTLASLHDEFLAILHKDLSGAMLVKNMASTFLNLIQKNVTLTKSMLLYKQTKNEEPKENKIVEDCSGLETELTMIITRALQIGLQDGSIKSDVTPKILALQIGFQMHGMLQFCIIDAKEKKLRLLEENNLTLSDLMENFLQTQFNQHKK